MRVAIIGSRSATQKDITKILYALPKSCIQIISGGAKGADSLAKQVAVDKNIPILEILPKYEKYGKSATIVRNKQIVDKADQVIALWDYSSAGTQSVIKYSLDTHTPCNVIQI